MDIETAKVGGKGEEEGCFEVDVGDVGEVDTGEDWEGAGDEGELYMEIVEGGAGGDALVLANPISKGVSEVK